MELSAIFQQTKSLLIPILVFWGLFSILNLFHFKISLFWRISVLFTFILFMILYYPFLQQEFDSWKHNLFYKPLEIFDSLLFLFSLIDIFFYLYWCYSLIKIFFSANEKQSETILRYLVVSTLLYWILSIIFQKKILQIPYREYYQILLKFFDH